VRRLDFIGKKIAKIVNTPQQKRRTSISSTVSIFFVTSTYPAESVLWQVHLNDQLSLIYLGEILSAFAPGLFLVTLTYPAESVLWQVPLILRLSLSYLGEILSAFAPGL
jgi:hypothetical protein